MIKNVQFDFPSPYWDEVSDVAKDLIRSLLVKDPKKRLNAEQLLEHPWVRGISTPRVQLSSVPQQIREYNARRKLKRAAYSIMAAKRFLNILNLNK